jgi:hypothetical protein
VIHTVFGTLWDEDAIDFFNSRHNVIFYLVLVYSDLLVPYGPTVVVGPTGASCHLSGRQSTSFHHFLNF